MCWIRGGCCVIGMHRRCREKRKSQKEGARRDGFQLYEWKELVKSFRHFCNISYSLVSSQDRVASCGSCLESVLA
jgi:hypothetical protein